MMSNLMQFERIFLTLYDPECEDEGPVWWIAPALMTAPSNG